MNLCVDCKYWAGNRKKHDERGECRKHAITAVGIIGLPKMNLVTQQSDMQPAIMSGFPTVPGTAWCGEFEPDVSTLN